MLLTISLSGFLSNCKTVEPTIVSDYEVTDEELNCMSTNTKRKLGLLLVENIANRKKIKNLKKQTNVLRQSMRDYDQGIKDLKKTRDKSFWKGLGIGAGAMAVLNFLMLIFTGSGR